MLKLNHANMGCVIVINPRAIVAIYESVANKCSHIVTPDQVWPVKETLQEILSAINLLDQKETKNGNQ